MSTDDNERAEQGGKKEVNGRDYSVVGDTVYEKNFWGNWKPVEDSQAKAEAGDTKKIDGQSYSVVGNTVYEKNLWGNWKEVSNDQDRAKAGDLNNVNRSDYSSVGDTTYRKNFFGNWEKVDDPQEKAAAGDIKNINRIDYSVTGDSVYRKNFFGNWEQVADKQERAEAGNMHQHNRIQYSNVGNQVYRKDFFGNWEEISAREVPEAVQAVVNKQVREARPDQSGPVSYRPPASSSNSDSSGFGTGIVVVIVIIAVIVIGYALFHQSNSSSSAVQQPQQVYYPTPATPDPEPAATVVQPVVADSGHVGFYINCDYCGPFKVYEDTVFLGTVPERRYAANRDCSSDDVLSVAGKVGEHVYNIRTNAGDNWAQTVNILVNDCQMIDVGQLSAKASEVVKTDPLANVPIASELRVLSPEDHSSFAFPRYTDVSWTPQVDLDGYEVELQLADKPYDYSATSFSPMPYSNQGIYPTTGTSLTVQGMGKQVHRVRIRAIKNGQIIATTPWRYFNYTN